MAVLNILHVLRAPVGGLFRHVMDLARAQAERGHRVGLIADSTTGGERAAAAFTALAPLLAHGITRVPMSRSVGPADWKPVLHTMRRASAARADVLHGHGAKGGAYARLAPGNRRAIRVYTPHGGSLLFSNETLGGRIYLATERFLLRRSDLLLFESQYSADMSQTKVGTPPCLTRVVHNGVSRAEFEPIVPAPDATDIVFIGELRELKGVDLLIDAIASLRRKGRPLTATLVGAGPDRDAFVAQAAEAGLSDVIKFPGAMNARQALALGRLMVVPSRAESLPYVVLETAAARVPLLTTRVGGIPEIYGPLSDALLPPDNADAIADAIATAFDGPDALIERTRALNERVSRLFSVDAMVDGILDGYRAALDMAQAEGRR
ncbi:glycosyltransferase family 4 protein [Undibacter mobilis]|uniref:Glycosyltransferase family 1 protein n=1 Tax=Undibacter mobilis TaxID=2292256 RepID=A0A371B1A9_9BRAD|nr:glycosyltransferase family 4 protein [Undibacter mobilis]RDV01330.1 glycosyltransferase family 1 protein [Undibacter mobilis]